jgi:hypothetical protein
MYNDGDESDPPLAPGVSAAARAATLRARAELAERGPRGERATGALLAPLRARGFVVLADVAIPRSRAVIDHIVIGPTGAFVVESRLWRSEEQVRGLRGKLFCGATYRGEEIDRLWWNRSKVIAEAGLDRFDGLNVHALMCIHGAPFEKDVLELEATLVVAPRALLYAVMRPERTLSAETVAAVAAAVMGALRPKHGGPWPALEAVAPR